MERSRGCFPENVFEMPRNTARSISGAVLPLVSCCVFMIFPCASLTEASPVTADESGSKAGRAEPAYRGPFRVLLAASLCSRRCRLHQLTLWWRSWATAWLALVLGEIRRIYIGSAGDPTGIARKQKNSQAHSRQLAILHDGMLFFVLRLHTPDSRAQLRA